MFLIVVAVAQADARMGAVLIVSRVVQVLALVIVKTLAVQDAPVLVQVTVQKIAKTFVSLGAETLVRVDA